jgi:hypothetical protein
LEESKMKTPRVVPTDAGLMLALIAISALFTIGTAWAGSELFIASGLSGQGAEIGAPLPANESASRIGFGQATNNDMFSSPNSLRKPGMTPEPSRSAPERSS